MKPILFILALLTHIGVGMAQKRALPTFESFKSIGVNPTQQHFLEQYSMEEQQQMLPIEHQQQQEKKSIDLSLGLEHQQQHFTRAVLWVHKMLEEPSVKYLTKKAVFHTENAFLGYTVSMEAFDQQIAQLALFLKRCAQYQGWNWNHYNTRQKTLMLLFTDTLFDGHQKLGPLEYDHKSPYGFSNYSKVFVSKLIQTQTGQCHSLPLLYKILADEIAVEASLCLMPQHSYIRLRDEEGRWYNFETTCGKIVPTAWLVASGFVSSEAIRHQIYMDTLGYTATLTYAMADLLNGYIHKFGYDKFVLKWVNIALGYHAKDIRCLQIKANCLTLQVQQLIQAAGYPPREDLPNHPKIWKCYQDLMQIYKTIDKLGHVDIPPVVYQKWLKTTKQ